ncbi:hypothetical protein LIER_27002 [Lithospermum erythrorhizon]|uniref:Protein RALF-like 34 n=1 Tax=Lithospermum erythrorhizon TaxID=34254 RepID=A0AAV3RAG3_LITER
MEPPKIIFLSLALIFLMCNILGQSQAEESGMSMMSDALDFPGSMSLYDEADLGEEHKEIDGGSTRRSLFWYHSRYYISYGALSANRIPCPPRSGRSYYTHNCYKATGPAHPYTRGCSAITRCRR